MKIDRSSTLYATLLLTGTGLFSQILGFFYRIALSRLIGAEIMGLYQLIMPVYSVFMSIVAVGLTTAVSTLTAEYQALGRTAAIHQALSLVLADPAFQHSAQHISEGFRAAGGYRRGADKILEAAMGSAPLP